MRIAAEPPHPRPGDAGAPHPFCRTTLQNPKISGPFRAGRGSMNKPLAATIPLFCRGRFGVVGTASRRRAAVRGRAAPAPGAARGDRLRAHGAVPRRRARLARRRAPLRRRRSRPRRAPPSPVAPLRLAVPGIALPAARRLDLGDGGGSRRSRRRSEFRRARRRATRRRSERAASARGGGGGGASPRSTRSRVRRRST